MRCHSRRVNAVFLSTPALGGVFRPLPMVVMGHLAAMWLTAWYCWLELRLLAWSSTPLPPFLLLHMTPLLPAGYWLHGICAALLLADVQMARRDPAPQRWARRGTWAVTGISLALSLWSYTGVHGHTQRALIEWLYVPQMWERAEECMALERMEKERGPPTRHFRDQALEWYERAVAIRPEDPEAHDRLAWHLLTDPDPEHRDLEAAQHHAEWAHRQAYEEDFWWGGTVREIRRHRELMGALSVLRGDRRKALEHLDLANPMQTSAVDDEDISLNFLQRIILENCADEQQRHRMTLILEGRPWDIQGPD